jgi:WD40 repeat protein
MGTRCSDFGPCLIGIPLEKDEATGFLIRRVVAWNALSGEVLHELRTPNQFQYEGRYRPAVEAFSRDGLYFALACGSEISVWDLRTGLLEWSRETRTEVCVLAFSYSGAWLASRSMDCIEIWSTEGVPSRSELYLSTGLTPSESGSLHSHSDDIHLSALCHGCPNTLDTWNTVTGSRVRSVNLEPNPHWPTYLNISSMMSFWCEAQTGPYLASFAVGSSIHIMNLISGEQTNTFSLSLSFSVRGRSRCGRYYLCGYSNGAIEVWSLSGQRSGERIIELQGEGRVWHLDLSISGKYLTSFHGPRVEEHVMTWYLGLQCTNTILNKVNE